MLWGERERHSLRRSGLLRAMIVTLSQSQWSFETHYSFILIVVRVLLAHASHRITRNRMWYVRIVFERQW
jgi:hypothetical protein